VPPLELAQLANRTTTGIRVFPQRFNSILNLESVDCGLWIVE